MYQVWSFWDKEFLSYPFRKVLDTNMTFDLDLMTWISRSRDQYRINDYQPTTFEASGANHSSNRLCYRLHDDRIYGHADIHTYTPTYQPTHKNVPSKMPFFFERGYTDVSMLRRVVQFITEKIGALDYVQ